MLRNLYLILTGKIKNKRWERHLYIKKQVNWALKQNSKAKVQKSFIKWSLKTCGIQPSQDLINLYSSFISFLQTNSFSLEDHKKFKAEVDLLKISPKEYKVLHEIYRIALSYGLFVIGYAFREKGVVACLNLNDEYLLDKLICLIEQGSFTDATKLIDRASAQQLNKEQKLIATWMIGIFTNQPDNDEHKILYKPADLEYEPFIANKKIAIVGPVVSEVEQGKEIDSFEQVLRFNHKGEIKDYKPEIYGQRVTLSYYSICHAKALVKLNYLPLLQELEFASFVKRKAYSFFKSDPIKSRQSYNFSWILKDTEFNIGPNSVFDLLRFKPSSISIFNTNLMLTTGRNKNYWPSSVGNVTDIEYFIENHDPVTQYQYFSHAYKAGLVTGDSQFCEVMEMGLDRYLKALQESHGFSKFQDK